MTIRAKNLGMVVAGAAGCALLLAACGAKDDSGGTAGTGGTGGTAGTGGTGGAWEATTPEECHNPEGCGGCECHPCDAVTLDLSNPLPLSGLEVELETSLGHTWTKFGETSQPYTDVSLVAEGEPVATLLLRQLVCRAYYTPEWVDLLLLHGGVEVANEHLDNFAYRCNHIGYDNYCWQAAPLTVPVTPP